MWRRTMSTEKQLTAREFVLNSGKCPACRSENVEWGSITVDANTTHQKARCMECDVAFQTVSRLVGYMMEPDWEARTIAEDFGEIIDTNESVDAVQDELLHADRIIHKLVRLIRKLGEFVKPEELKAQVPPLRNKERAAALRKGRL
jgi:hypothetical protein